MAETPLSIQISRRFRVERTDLDFETANSLICWWFWRDTIMINMAE
jgi:hypothetical protein